MVVHKETLIVWSNALMIKHDVKIEEGNRTPHHNMQHDKQKQISHNFSF